MDMSDTIIPKSDQLNAEDLLSGPRTVTIVEVCRGSTEQPVEIVLAEFGEGRPFKPSKTVRRILVKGWGLETSAYVGRRMTIFCDASVRFGGQDVGGIRISHMSGLDAPLKLALTVTRGRRAPYIVQPLAEAPADSGSPLRQQITDAIAHYRDTWKVTTEQLVARIGRATTAWTAQDLSALRTLSGELKQRKKRVEDEFPAATAPAETTSADESLFGGDTE